MGSSGLPYIWDNTGLNVSYLLIWSSFNKKKEKKNRCNKTPKVYCYYAHKILTALCIKLSMCPYVSTNKSYPIHAESSRIPHVFVRLKQHEINFWKKQTGQWYRRTYHQTHAHARHLNLKWMWKEQKPDFLLLFRCSTSLKSTPLKDC